MKIQGENGDRVLQQVITGRDRAWVRVVGAACQQTAGRSGDSAPRALEAPCLTLRVTGPSCVPSETGAGPGWGRQRREKSADINTPWMLLSVLTDINKNYSWHNLSLTCTRHYYKCSFYFIFSRSHKAVGTLNYRTGDLGTCRWAVERWLDLGFRQVHTSVWSLISYEALNR